MHEFARDYAFAEDARIEQILPIPLARPRGLEARRTPVFNDATEAITSIFLSRGVLKGTQDR